MSISCRSVSLYPSPLWLYPLCLCLAYPIRLCLRICLSFVSVPCLPNSFVSAHLCILCVCLSPWVASPMMQPNEHGLCCTVPQRHHHTPALAYSCPTPHATALRNVLPLQFSARQVRQITTFSVYELTSYLHIQQEAGIVMCVIPACWVLHNISTAISTMPWLTKLLLKSQGTIFTQSDALSSAK